MARRLAAILAADVVGYSRLMAEDEAGTLAALKAHRRDLFDPEIARRGGRIVKLMGDGVLVEFPSVVDAVGCALAIQEALSREGGEIALRIGINLGDVIVDGDDIYGDGVNVAARLEAIAEPGGVCVSDMVLEAVRGKLDCAAHDLGEVDLKNIARPIRVWSLSIGSPSAGPDDNRQQKPLSIAVMAFENLSGVPEQQFIGDSISENIITELSRFRDITVIARNSTFAYKGRPTRVQDIRRDLNVEFILDGSMQQAGDRIRVTAQLIEGTSGQHVWAQRYDRHSGDLFEVMDTVTELIVGTLATTHGGRLRRAAHNRSNAARPSDFRAFDEFLKGMEAFNRFTKDSVAEAAASFERALEIDPRYAKAYAKLAIAHLVDISFGWSKDPAVSLTKAETAANASLRADDAEAWGHWAAAGCSMAAGRNDLCMSSMSRAVELNPYDADILTDMGLYCAYDGRASEGLEFALRGMRINPHYPDYYAAQLGQIYFDARLYEDAVKTLVGVRTMDTPLMQAYLAACHAALGHGFEARSVCARLMISEPASSVSYWASPLAAPYRNVSDRDHLAANLRAAGLPE